MHLDHFGVPMSGSGWVGQGAVVAAVIAAVAAIVGGLIVSQALTLFTTPVVYLYMDRMRLRFARKCRPAISPSPSSAD